MKFNVENWTFSFTVNGKKYLLTVDDESCELGCTFSIIIRDSAGIEDLRERLAKRGLKYCLYEVNKV